MTPANPANTVTASEGAAVWAAAHVATPATARQDAMKLRARDLRADNLIVLGAFALGAAR